MIDLATPQALLALLAMPVLAWAVRRAAARRRDGDAAYGGSEALRRGRSRARRRARTALLFAALALVAVAAARPRWGTEDVPVSRSGIDIAIALDISRSMTAADVEPSRAAAAAAGLRRMLESLRGDRVGLVTFGGSAFSRSPLTLDLNAVVQLVEQAQGEALLVQPGTNLGTALQRAITLLDVEDRAATQVVVLVSDGEELGRRLDAAIRRAQDAGIRIYTAAVGTEAGVPIPSDDQGGTELSRLDRATLSRIAAETGGQFREIDGVAGLVVEFSRLRQSQFAAAEQPAPVERFQWFVGAALALLFAQSLIGEATRPGPLRAGRITLGATALLAVLFVACGGSAAYRHVRDGNEAYADGRYEQALTQYRLAAELQPEDASIAYNTGNALHELRRYEEASVASERALLLATDVEVLQEATYALGGHAFRRGALEEARDAYVSVLRRDPADEDARHNLEVVLLALNPPEPTPPREDPAQNDNRRPDGGDDDGQRTGGQQADGGAAAAGGDTAQTPDGQQQPGTTFEPGDGPPVVRSGLDGEPGVATTLEGAQLSLEEALAGLGREVTLDEALRILKLLRRVNSFQSLGEVPPRPGALPDR